LASGWWRAYFLQGAIEDRPLSWANFDREVSICMLMRKKLKVMGTLGYGRIGALLCAGYCFLCYSVNGATIDLDALLMNYLKARVVEQASQKNVVAGIKYPPPFFDSSSKEDSTFKKKRPYRFLTMDGKEAPKDQLPSFYDDSAAFVVWERLTEQARGVAGEHHVIGIQWMDGRATLFMGIFKVEIF